MQYYSKGDTGCRVKKCRQAKGWTLNQLSEKMGFASVRQLQRIERGENSISIDRLVELAQILGVSTDYLLIGATEKADEVLLSALNEMQEAEVGFLIQLIGVIREYSICQKCHGMTD